MRWRVEYAEYLAEVRAQVCGHCPERVPDRPPFGPACRHCGVELQLNRIVESIHDAGEAVGEYGPPPDRRTACARCTCLGGGTCPCPAGALTERVVRAVKAVDARREQQEVLRRRLARRLSRDRAAVVEMIRAYEAATGAFVCCD
jgi:hypothetical protein